MARVRKRSGDWAKPKTATVERHEIARLPDERDRRILDSIAGAGSVYSGWSPFNVRLPVPPLSVLNLTLQRTIVPEMCHTGRLLLRVAPGLRDPTADERLVPIEWDPAPAQFRVRIASDERAGYIINAALWSEGRERPHTDAIFLTTALILWQPPEPGGHPRFSPFDVGGAERWLTRLLAGGPVTVPAEHAGELVEMLAVSSLVHVDCPEELRVETAADPPTPVIRLSRGPAGHVSRSADRVEATLSFAYGSGDVDAWSTRRVLFDREHRKAWRRHREAEESAVTRLQSLGVRRLADWHTGGTRLDLAASALPALTRVLLSEGWRVEADGRLYRVPGAVALDVRSGIDWFELHGQVDFGGVTADLPALLAAARRGDAFVPLGDGTFGMLPEDWLARGGRLAALGTPEGDHIRFASSQTALLDAWLAAQPEVTCDETFSRARAELARFDGIAPLDAPSTFRGALRDYQRDALGWFDFLRRFAFGGCLADEMGLGKTIMVLAALEARRLERERAGSPANPSLVVVPRSLVFNWRQEAARFAPALRVLDLTGAGRGALLDRIVDHDVVFATYGTLRRDAGELKEIRFDYAILDEAQAIKNARTSSAKAARLLKADRPRTCAAGAVRRAARSLPRRPARPACEGRPRPGQAADPRGAAAAPAGGVSSGADRSRSRRRSRSQARRAPPATAGACR